MIKHFRMACSIESYVPFSIVCLSGKYIGRLFRTYKHKCKMTLFILWLQEITALFHRAGTIDPSISLLLSWWWIMH